MQAANGGEDGPPFVHCIYCTTAASLPAGIHPASSLAQHCEQLLCAQHGVELIITEAKALNGKHGAFDFSLLLRCPHSSSNPRRLDIEVDGLQHFTKQMYDTTAQRQQAADKRKDKAAWAQGRCLVRLHYLDRRFWQSKIQEAVRRATFPARNKLLLYTPSYGRKDRVAPFQVSRAGGLQQGAHSHSIGWDRGGPWCMTKCPA